MPITSERTTLLLTVQIEFDVDPASTMSEEAIADQIVEAAREAAPTFASVKDVFAMKNCDLKWTPDK